MQSLKIVCTYLCMYLCMRVESSEKYSNPPMFLPIPNSTHHFRAIFPAGTKHFVGSPNRKGLLTSPKEESLRLNRSIRVSILGDSCSLEVIEKMHYEQHSEKKN